MVERADEDPPAVHGEGLCVQAWAGRAEGPEPVRRGIGRNLPPQLEEQGARLQQVPAALGVARMYRQHVRRLQRIGRHRHGDAASADRPEGLRARLARHEAGRGAVGPHLDLAHGAREARGQQVLARDGTLALDRIVGDQHGVGSLEIQIPGREVARDARAV